MQNLNDLIKKKLMSRYTRSNGVSLRNTIKKSCSSCGGGNARIIIPVPRTLEAKQTCTTCTKIFDMHGN
jgi:hypothetical protein